MPCSWAGNRTSELAMAMLHLCSANHHLLAVLYFWLNMYGIFSCRPDGLGLSRGFYRGSNEQHRLFQPSTQHVRFLTIMHCINLQTHTKGHLKKESRCNYWRAVDQRRSAVLFIADSEHLLKHSAFGRVLFTTLALQMNQLLLDHLHQRRLVNYINRSSQIHCHSTMRTH